VALSGVLFWHWRIPGLFPIFLKTCQFHFWHQGLCFAHCWFYKNQIIADSVQRISNKNSQNRHNRQIHHVTGSKGFSQLSYEKVKNYVTRFSFRHFVYGLCLCPEWQWHDIVITYIVFVFDRDIWPTAHYKKIYFACLYTESWKVLKLLCAKKKEELGFLYFFNSNKYFCYLLFLNSWWISSWSLQFIKASTFP